jgi:hypothetical protein
LFVRVLSPQLHGTILTASDLEPEQNNQDRCEQEQRRMKKNDKNKIFVASA